MHIIDKSLHSRGNLNNSLASGLSFVNQLSSTSPSFVDAIDFFAYYTSCLAKISPKIEHSFCYSRAGHLINLDSDHLYLMGCFPHRANSKLEDITQSDIIRQKAVGICLERKKHVFMGNTACLYLSHDGFDAVFYIVSKDEIEQESQLLLEYYASITSIKLGNLNLKHKLRRLAHYDWLTSLPNRAEFLKQISIQKSSNFSHSAVALIDIKHFSDINDGLGMDIGSAVLVAVADRLKSVFSNKVQLGRISGDVFGILADLSELEPKCIEESFKNPLVIGPHIIPININIGICKLDHHSDGAHFLRCATIALNQAKKNLVENYSFYDSDMDQQTKHKLEMIRLLQKAFEKEELELWYQPQVDLVSEKVIGLEALLRWKYDDNSYVSPEEFVPLAEYSGLILGIGEWVIIQAAQTLSKLNSLGITNMRIAVNVSVLQFRSPGFVEFVCKTLQQYSLQPHLFELEITESVVMDEPQIVIKALNELKSKGFKIALDDFGTGFSSLSYLQKLPLDRIKVDKSFVSDLSNPRHRVIAHSIFALGAQLGLQTIAEGVETRSQASHMLRLGADEAQGFLYSKALPFDKLSLFLLKSLS